jgi:hypothetical protein
MGNDTFPHPAPSAVVSGGSSTGTHTVVTAYSGPGGAWSGTTDSLLTITARDLTDAAFAGLLGA